MTTTGAPSAGPTFYDVQEVAAMLKMSRMTVYRAISTGELHPPDRAMTPAKST